MIEKIRSAYNGNFSESKYKAFLADLDKIYNHKITFRVAETPVFVGREFKEKLVAAGNEIIDFIIRPDFKKLTEGAIPANLNVPNETEHTHFLALDFAVVDGGEGLEPRLIEMQGFPSLFGWQDVMANEFRDHFNIPARYQSHFGLSSSAYRELLKDVLVNGHAPEEVILLE